MHKLLKGLSRVDEPEGHPQELEQPKRRGHRLFRHVGLLYADLIVNQCQIYAAEDASTQ